MLKARIKLPESNRESNGKDKTRVRILPDRTSLGVQGFCTERYSLPPGYLFRNLSLSILSGSFVPFPSFLPAGVTSGDQELYSEYECIIEQKTVSQTSHTCQSIRVIFRGKLSTRGVSPLHRSWFSGAFPFQPPFHWHKKNHLTVRNTKRDMFSSTIKVIQTGVKRHERIARAKIPHTLDFCNSPPFYSPQKIDGSCR